MAYRSHKAAIRVRSEAFVKDNSRNLALRDMRNWIRTPKKFGGMSLAAVFATMIRPFGSHVPGTIGLTLIYWLLMIGVTFPVGFMISNICTTRSHWPSLSR